MGAEGGPTVNLPAIVADSGNLAVNDVASVRNLIEAKKNTNFFRERRARNVAPPAPQFSREAFWHAMIGCLLTTQQRSTRGTPVQRFLDLESFSLPLDACAKQASIEQFVLERINNHGAIRRGNTIAREASKNWKRLNEGRWKEVEMWFELLKGRRASEPKLPDRDLERDAARWAAATFAGFGPKQSRNLWQWVGLTRYEIPLDSRVAHWVNTNLSVQIKLTGLGRLNYYESVLDEIQALCEKAGVLPCELDAAAFDFDDTGWSTPLKVTTEVGFVNTHGQVTIRNTGKPGADYNQYIYQIACSRCGHIYGANGSDIVERKCPNCQDGRTVIEN